jgi:dienelactone hydrolase
MNQLLCTILVLSLAACSVHAEIKTQTVEYTADGVKMIGYLAYDDATADKRPGVLVVHEWWGLNDYPKSRARQLAQLGYVAFAADIYGDGKTVTTADEAGKLAGAARANLAGTRARAAAALEQLKANPRVDANRTAAIGYCFGGSVVLEMARAGADLRGVVPFHGALATSMPATAKPKAKLLICHGADDPFIPGEQIAAFLDELRKVGADYQFNMYSGAVHAFTNPDAAKAGLNGVAYNAEADTHSWEDMKRFFAEVLAAR